MSLLGFFGSDDTELRMRWRQAVDPATQVEGNTWAIACLRAKSVGESVATVTYEGTGVGFVSGHIFNPDPAVPIAPRNVPIDALEEGRPPLPWGRWAAAAVDPGSNQLLLARDHLGLAPLYVAQRAGGFVFGSRLRDVLGLLGGATSVDWDFLTSYVRHCDVPERRSPFREVSRVPQGAVLYCHPNQQSTQRVYWDPFVIAQQPTDVDIEVFRSLITDCVARWIGDLPAVATDLSGGMDSSTVTWAAAQSGREVTALHLVDEQHGEADEWRFAESVAVKLGIELTRISSKHTLPLTPSSKSIEFDLPTFELLLQAENATRATALPNTLLLTGQGGDQIFLASASAGHYLHDAALYRNGRGIFSSLLAHSRTLGTPVLQSAATLFRNEIARWQRGSYLLRRVVYESDAPLWLSYGSAKLISGRECIPDLVDEIPRLPGGKMGHVAGVLQTASTVPTIVGRSSQQVLHPLLSQPLVDMAIRIQACDHAISGRSRVVLRKMMEGRLPETVLARQDKGAYMGRFQRGLRKNFTRAQELIHDGRLAREGIVDAKLANEHLQQLALGANNEIVPMLCLLSAELWLDAWK